MLSFALQAISNIVSGRSDYAQDIAQTVASIAISDSANNASGAEIILKLEDIIQQFIDQYNKDPGSNAPKEVINRHLQAQALAEAAKISYLLNCCSFFFVLFCFRGLSYVYFSIFDLFLPIRFCQRFV